MGKYTTDIEAQEAPQCHIDISLPVLKHGAVMAV